LIVDRCTDRLIDIRSRPEAETHSFYNDAYQKSSSVLVGDASMGCHFKDGVIVRHAIAPLPAYNVKRRYYRRFFCIGELNSMRVASNYMQLLYVIGDGPLI